MEIPRERRQLPEFAFVYKMYNDIAGALGAPATELFQEGRPQPMDRAYTSAETVIYNLQHDRFEALFVKVRVSSHGKLHADHHIALQ